MKKSSTLCLTNEALNIIREEYKKRIIGKTIMEKQGGFAPLYYPAEVIASVQALGVTLNDTLLTNWANNELINLEKNISLQHGYLIWPDKLNEDEAFGSNSQARLVLSLALIYKHTHDSKTLAILHKSFDALDRLPKTLVTNSISGKDHQLPYYAYKNTANPTPVSSRTLDPNQDASLALAYALYSELNLSESRKTQILAQANKYLNAAFDMSSINKCLPLADHQDYINLCDTRYNGWWLAQVYEATKILGRFEEFEKYLKSEYMVIRHYLNIFQTNRQYPTYYTGAYPDPVEPFLLMNIISKFDDALTWNIYTDNLNNFILDKKEKAPFWPSGSLYPSYFLNRT